MEHRPTDQDGQRENDGEKRVAVHCFFSRHRVVAVASEGVAAQEPSQAEVSTPSHSVFFDCFHSVLRARWHISATRTHPRRNHLLVSTDRVHRYPPCPASSSHLFHRFMSRSETSISLSIPQISAVESFLTPRRAITTTSAGRPKDPRLYRNHSRTARLTRFRPTALSTRRLTVTPRRVLSTPEPRLDGAMRITNGHDTTRSPTRETRWKSRRLKSRSTRPKRPVRGHTATLTDSQLRGVFAPFPAAASKSHDHYVNSFEPEIHDSVSDEFDWADTFASSRRFPFIALAPDSDGARWENRYRNPSSTHHPP